MCTESVPDLGEGGGSGVRSTTKNQ